MFLSLLHYNWSCLIEVIEVIKDKSENFFQIDNLIGLYQFN